MRTILVAGLPGRAGKSTIIAALAARLHHEGVPAAYVKVVGQDGADFEAVERGRACFERTVGPARVTTPDTASAAVNDVSQGREVTFVEAPGSVLAPGADWIALAEGLDARVILVARYYPGLAADRVLAAARPAGERLLGVVLNALPPSFLGYANEKLVPDLASGGIRVLGRVGVHPVLELPTIGELATLLNGRFLNDEEKRDELIEHVLVGARSWDPASPYLALKSGFAFITRGDLQDVQLAAINETTRCIVLTENILPSTAVRYRAAEAGIPVIVTPHDTLTAIKTLDAGLATLGFVQPAKAPHALAALEQRTDLHALTTALRGA